MQIRGLMTVGAIVAGSLFAQAQGGMGMNALWMKYQDKLSPVQDYSATVVMDAGGRTMTSKMFKLGKKTRMEVNMEGMPMQVISIMDLDAEDGKGVAYTLMPAMKTYMKMPLPQDAAAKADAKPDIKIEELGKEDVDGVSCDKRRVTITPEGGKPQAMTLWASAAAKNMPVKLAVADGPGATVIRFKDYDFKKPSADLFTIPDGYTASDMGRMMRNAQPPARKE